MLTSRGTKGLSLETCLTSQQSQYPNVELHELRHQYPDGALQRSCRDFRRIFVRHIFLKEYILDFPERVGREV